jgi:hypothetical protein
MQDISQYRCFKKADKKRIKTKIRVISLVLFGIELTILCSSSVFRSPM